MRKIRFFVDFENEEKWLNKMSEKGYHFEKYIFFCYFLKKDKSKRYTYRLQLLDSVPTTKKSMDYIRFIEETGIEYVANWFRWVYFRKEYSTEGFKIFSDIDSKIKHYKMIITLLGPIGLLNVGIAVSNALNERIGDGIRNSFVAMILLNFILGTALLAFVFKYILKMKKLKKQKKISE